MMTPKNPNVANLEDASLPTHHRRVCNFFLCVCNFWKSIHKFARKHFKRSTTTTTRSDTSSTNPNLRIERLDTSSTNPNISIERLDTSSTNPNISIERLDTSSTNPNIDTSSTNPKISIVSLPSLPFDLITEIISRLPVKLLLQLRCVSKSWNSLISNDPKFAIKHLNNSTTRSICSINFGCPFNLTFYPPNFFFDTTVSTKQLWFHTPNCKWAKDIVGSCNGILCLAYKEFILLWNPYIGKLKELPLLQNPDCRKEVYHSYGFGYDSVTDHYKVVVVLWNTCSMSIEVKVNTLGTKIWKKIQEFPFGTCPDEKSGKYASGTINWLGSSKHCPRPPYHIVSLDLGNESYQTVLQPDYGEVDANSFLTLDVLRDCLCIICGHDVWLMKEYGKKESWTKLFTISYKQDPSLSFSLKKVIYVFDDGQVLLQMKMPCFPPQLIVYDPRIGTFEFVMFQENLYGSRFGYLGVSKYGGLQVCIESLISPSS